MVMGLVAVQYTRVYEDDEDYTYESANDESYEDVDNESNGDANVQADEHVSSF